MAVVLAAMAGIAIAVVEIPSNDGNPSGPPPAALPTSQTNPTDTGVTSGTSGSTSGNTGGQSAGGTVSEAQREHAFAADLLVLGDNDPFRLVAASELMSLGQTVCQSHRKGVPKTAILSQLTGFDRYDAVLFYDTAITKLCPR